VRVRSSSIFRNRHCIAPCLVNELICMLSAVTTLIYCILIIPTCSDHTQYLYYAVSVPAMCARHKSPKSVRPLSASGRGARGRLLMPVAPKDARERGDYRPYLRFCVGLGRALAMPVPAWAKLWPSEAARVDGSASASPKCHRVPTCAKKIARAKAEKQAIP